MIPELLWTLEKAELTWGSQRSRMASRVCTLLTGAY